VIVVIQFVDVFAASGEIEIKLPSFLCVDTNEKIFWDGAGEVERLEGQEMVLERGRDDL
jgi:hypothetical protein